MIYKKSQLNTLVLGSLMLAQTTISGQPTTPIGKLSTSMACMMIIDSLLLVAVSLFIYQWLR